MRRGFTLVEAIVALVLFQFGILAVAAAGALAARDLAVARNSARAEVIARNRVESIRARACPEAGQGSLALPSGVLERWRVEASGFERRIWDSVAYPVPHGGSASAVARATALCEP